MVRGSPCMCPRITYTELLTYPRPPLLPGTPSSATHRRNCVQGPAASLALRQSQSRPSGLFRCAKNRQKSGTIHSPRKKTQEKKKKKKEEKTASAKPISGGLSYLAESGTGSFSRPRVCTGRRRAARRGGRARRGTSSSHPARRTSWTTRPWRSTRQGRRWPLRPRSSPASSESSLGAPWSTPEPCRWPCRRARPKPSRHGGTWSCRARTVPGSRPRAWSWQRWCWETGTTAGRRRRRRCAESSKPGTAPGT